MEEARALDSRLLPGTLAMLILRALGTGAMHGAAVAGFIRLASEQVLQVEEGALYPALHRLESKGWVSSQWGASENRRRAKFYRLTPSGREELLRENARWTRLAQAIGRVMEGA